MLALGGGPRIAEWRDMKTTIAISAVLLAALSACAEQPPPREPTTATTYTTANTTYPAANQQHRNTESASSAYGQESPGATYAMGSANSDGTYTTSNNGGVVHKSSGSGGCTS